MHKTCIALMAIVGCAVVDASGQQPASHAATSPVPDIPLRVGLTVVTAIHEPDQGDYESIKTIRQITTTDVTLSYSADRVPAGIDGLTSGEEGRVRNVRATRTVSRADLSSARTYRAVFGPEDPERFAGTTALGISTQLFEQLKAGRSIELRLAYSGNTFPLTGLLNSLLGGAAPAGLADAEAVPGTLRRADMTTLPVLVNDTLVNLPALHAVGRFQDQDAEIWWLDDAANPLTLKWQIGDERLQAIRLSFPADTRHGAGKASPTPSGAKPGVDPAATERLEKALADTGRVTVYGIYFDFASDRIREESEPVLLEIAAVMTKHPTWTLSVEGHTDGIGSADANLDLSRRRATAVTRALSTRYSVVPTRFVPGGYGESRPQDTNDTIEGRARNRRVELVRREP